MVRILSLKHSKFLPERITPSWSSRHCLLWPQKGILRSFGRETKLCEWIGDISVVMQVAENSAEAVTLERKFYL